MSAGEYPTSTHMADAIRSLSGEIAAEERAGVPGRPIIEVRQEKTLFPTAKSFAGTVI